jgi:hypothetical protein
MCVIASSPHPFALSLSKCPTSGSGFDKLSPNGWGDGRAKTFSAQDATTKARSAAGVRMSSGMSKSSSAAPRISLGGSGSPRRPV